MTCSKCRHEFCWICMGDWAEHGSNTGGYYKCNKFDPNASDGDDQSDAAKAKRELDRYLHYYKRFHGHSQAQDFARKSVRETEARMVLLQEQNSETVWTDVEFLKAANELLVECRRVLKYTYVHAYYLEDVGKRSRFEYHQEMLERFTETLSELSEKPLKEMNRTEVVNQVRARMQICNTRFLGNSQPFLFVPSCADEGRGQVHEERPEIRRGRDGRLIRRLLFAGRRRTHMWGPRITRNVQIEIEKNSARIRIRARAESLSL